MKKFDFNGNLVELLEHMSEVKGKSDLFNRFYNKKQMFKFFLGKYVFKDGDDVEISNTPEDADYLGIPCGTYVKLGSEDISITFYRVEDLDPIFTDTIMELYDWGPSFFIQEDSGQIYFVEIGEG